eukprot:jgi/Hompol1/3623/HPOL_006651-RA
MRPLDSPPAASWAASSAASSAGSQVPNDLERRSATDTNQHQLQSATHAATGHATTDVTTAT